MFRLSLLAALGAALSLVTADGIYTDKSPVLQLNAKTYESLIAQSNHTSIVEFYAPWCGHCQNLKPAYEKAANNLAGLAKVAAVNCDEESNKPLCARFDVRGFPTLKIVKAGKKQGKPIVEDYQGQRTTKAIVDAVIDKIPNHVKRLQDTGLDAWLKETSQAKAILFTEKGTTAALIRALAVDFLGSIEFAQVRSKETKAVEKYEVTSFPTIVLLPNQDGEPITYSGEMKKEALTEFFSQVAAPNPDPAPQKGKASSSSKKIKPAASSASASSKFSKASEAHKSSDFEDYLDHASTIVLDDNTPTDSPLPIVEQEKPMVVPEVTPPIPTLSTAAELASACLTPGSGNCILVLLPRQDEAASVLPAVATQALSAFADVAEKYHKRRANIFPFYAIPSENENAGVIRQDLSLKSDTNLQVIVLNMKRNWWRLFEGEDYSVTKVESFVDAIRFGEGAKQKLPEIFFSESISAEGARKTAAETDQEGTKDDSEESTSESAPSAATSAHDEL